MINKNGFAEILNKYDYTVHNGDIVAGTIIHQEKTGFLVEIGTKNVAYLPKEEININLVSKNNYNLLLLNVTTDFFLLTKNSSNQQYVLSIRRLDYIRAWKRIKQLYLEDIVFELYIQRINKGGIITYLEGIQGFIPKSHIIIRKQERIKEKKISCKLLNLNENKNQLILSNKSAKLMLCKHKFKLGELMYGRILAQRSYGIFINISNVKALLHTSEIHPRLINKHRHVLQIGSLIKVKIIYINIKQGLVSVSISNVEQDISLLLQY